MTNPLGDSLAALLRSVLGDEPMNGRQVATEDQHTFESVHEFGHFMMEQLGHNLADMMRLTNLPQLLNGPATPENNKAHVSAECLMSGDDAVRWQVKIGGRLVMEITADMFPRNSQD